MRETGGCRGRDREEGRGIQRRWGEIRRERGGRRVFREDFGALRTGERVRETYALGNGETGGIEEGREGGYGVKKAFEM